MEANKITPTGATKLGVTAAVEKLGATKLQQNVLPVKSAVEKKESHVILSLLVS